MPQDVGKMTSDAKAALDRIVQSIKQQIMGPQIGPNPLDQAKRLLPDNSLFKAPGSPDPNLPIFPNAGSPVNQMRMPDTMRRIMEWMKQRKLAPPYGGPTVTDAITRLQGGGRGGGQ